MPGCSAIGCNSHSNDGHKLFLLPSGKNDQQRRAIWLAMINRPDFNPSQKGAYLCEIHFQPKEFERNICGKLKPNAIPSIFGERDETDPPKYPKKKRKPPKERKPLPKPKSPQKRCRKSSMTSDNFPLVDMVNKDHAYFTESLPIHDANDIPSPGPHKSILLRVSQNRPIQPSPACETQPVQTQVPRSDSVMIGIPEEMKILKNKLEGTKRKVRQLLKERETMEKKLQSLFNVDQMRFLEKSNPSIVWLDDTINKAIQLRSACGSNGYNMLLAQGFPLPSDRTLRRKLQHEHFNNEGESEEMDELMVSIP